MYAGGGTIAGTSSGAAVMSETMMIASSGEESRTGLSSLRMAPGLGFAASDRVALFLDREDGLMRRVRFSLDGVSYTIDLTTDHAEEFRSALSPYVNAARKADVAVRAKSSSSSWAWPSVTAPATPSSPFRPFKSY